MESASGVLKIERAKRKDIKELVDLIYITEPEPQEEWGYGSEKEMKRNLRKLLSMRNNRFSIENIIVARKGKELVGMLLYLNGKNIDELTRNSEKFIVKTQKGRANTTLYSFEKGARFDDLPMIHMSKEVWDTF